MIKKIIIAIFVVTVGCAVANAQNLQTFRYTLSLPDSLYSSRVIVREHGAAAKTVAAVDTEQQSVKGYRIRIYFDNSQHARGGAESAQAQFKELFPGIPTYLVYEIPSFKVSVGNCLTMEEALVLLGRIKDAFPKAFPMQENIPIADFKQ